MLASDPTTTIGQLTAIFNANNGITSWVHALENAVLPVLDPQPAWYDQINGALQTSQDHSMSWLTTTGPQVHAQVSQSFIDYNNLFQVMAPNLGRLVAQIAGQGNIPNAQQQQDLATYVNQLLKQATSSQQAIQGLLATMTAYRTQMGTDHGALTSAVAAAVAQEDQDRVAIEQVQQQITAILQKLSADSTKANDSDMNYNTAIISVIVGFTFGLAIAGGVLALGGFAAAVLSVGTGITFTQLYSNDVSQDLQQLTTLMSELADDKQQLAMVQGVLSSLQSLLDSNDDALQSFSSFTDIWDWTVYGLQYLLVVLAQPQIDVSKIPDLNDLAAAAAAWQQLADFAQKVQNATLQQQAPIAFPMLKTTSPQLRLVK
ncbi:MAG TPA: HBL/NHE enterotoxin family protein [Thermomicrobiaceae bacterium]|nr:HBL/NHE enterotoxin family protein [Thermomicrobiaceae bacterium]